MAIFLTPEEVAELTGIRRGRNGKTRDELQAEQLRSMLVQFRINAAGRVIVTVAAVEGGRQNHAPIVEAWSPNILKH
ncbi:MAG: DUF4224 domain-containing protein [Methylophilaceae bacterium]|nr:DUF4224 domain-containing protein [Methyloradius sp.]